MINQVIIAGRLVADAEVRNANGNYICSFTLANNEKRSGAEEQTTFIEVVVFGNYAKSLSKYLLKGISIDVVGRLVQEIWEKDEKRYSKHKIYAKEIDFRESKKELQTNSADGENYGI